VVYYDICMSARVVLKPSASLAVEWFKPHNCGNQDHSRVKYSFCYTRVIILVTTLRTASGRGPKPFMDLDFTHAIKTSGTTLKITRVCAVVTGRYCMYSGLSCTSAFQWQRKVSILVIPQNDFLPSGFVIVFTIMTEFMAEKFLVLFFISIRNTV